MRPVYTSGGPALTGSKLHVIVCCWDISRPIPADTSQVSVPTFTDDWASAGEATKAAKAAAPKDAR
jgi:hypothetical protein